MAKKWPPRPAENFRVTALQWQLDAEANHRRAGFPPVSVEVVARRFWQLLSFLQKNGLTTRTVAGSLEDVVPGLELWNSDLTPQGYAFVQRYSDRWLSRLYKDMGTEKEQKFLEKWYAQFISLHAGA